MAHGARRHGGRSFLHRVAAGLVLLGATALPATANTANAATASPTGSFTGITCPSPTSCLATGTYGDAKHKYVQPLVGRWAADHWVVTRAPIPQPSNPQTSRGSLSSIACATSKRCFAVGSFDQDDGPGIHHRTLIEQWDGTRWTLASRIRPAGSMASVLSDVDCPSATRCFAVGQWENVDFVTDVFLTEWNGKTWSIVKPPPIPYKVRQSRLTSISCATASWCVAVGTYQLPAQLAQTLTEHWDGTRWRWVSSPNAPKPMNYIDVLAGVSCASPTSCLAVGSQSEGGESGRYETLSLRWTGTRWIVVSTPRPAARNVYFLNGAACPANNACFSVGNRTYYTTTGYRQVHPHVERWDGKTWSVPNTGLAEQPPLSAIECRSRSDCIAVGGGPAPVVARWNGSAWSAESVPVVPGPA